MCIPYFNSFTEPAQLNCPFPPCTGMTPGSMTPGVKATPGGIGRTPLRDNLSINPNDEFEEQTFVQYSEVGYVKETYNVCNLRGCLMD